MVVRHRQRWINVRDVDFLLNAQGLVTGAVVSRKKFVERIRYALMLLVSAPNCRTYCGGLGRCRWPRTSVNNTLVVN